MKLANLRKLKSDMKNKKWSICSFIFKYKNYEYIVLVKLFADGEKPRNQYALVKLHFMRSGNLAHELEVEANANRLLTDAKTLREYFEIAFSLNIGDILKQLTERLGKSIPEHIPDDYSEKEVTAMIRSLSKSDSEDYTKVFCYKLRRNPEGSKRSVYNSDKTRLLRPALFEKLKADSSISFCYTDRKDKENSDEIILRKFT